MSRSFKPLPVPASSRLLEHRLKWGYAIQEGSQRSAYRPPLEKHSSILSKEQRSIATRYVPCSLRVFKIDNKADAEAYLEDTALYLAHRSFGDVGPLRRRAYFRGHETLLLIAKHELRISTYLLPKAERLRMWDLFELDFEYNPGVFAYRQRKGKGNYKKEVTK